MLLNFSAQILEPVGGANCPEDDNTGILCNFKDIKKVELQKIKDEQDEMEEDMEYFKSEGVDFYDLDSEQGLAEANALANYVGCVLKTYYRTMENT